MSLPTNRQDGDVIENEDINALASAINDHEGRLTSLESGSGTSGPGGTTIQVGGSQPSSGWWLDNGTVAPDGTAPSTPTGLTATATGGSTVVLSWSASSDNIGVTGYNYRIGTGAAINAGAGTTETVTGLSALTAYSFQVQAYDAQGNVSGWSTAANATTLDGPDTTAPTPGTLAASAITQSTFTLTVTGASDTVGLHATPYAFSTDNGATWSAWQAGATYNVTGRTASTAYQARHKVRDAAGNEATGTAITVTTSAPTPIYADTFTRANTSAGGTLGTTETGGQAWVDPSNVWAIQNNVASRRNIGKGQAYVDIGQTSARAVFKIKLNGSDCTYGAFVGGVAELVQDGDARNGYWVRVSVSPDGSTIGLSGNVSSPGQLLITDLVGSGITPADGDVIDFTVVEDGAKATVTVKRNDVVIKTTQVTSPNRPQGSLAGMSGSDVGFRGGIDEIAVYGV